MASIRSCIEYLYVVLTGVKCIPQFPKYEYRYFCYVTNDRLSPWKSHQKYAKRSACENWIEWCKNQMAAGTILTNDFWANSAIFQTCVLAYNLKVWLMLLSQGEKIRLEPDSVRYWFIHIPAAAR